MTSITAKGRGVTMELSGSVLKIRRSAIAPGGSGEKIIPIDQITAVQFKPATWATLGRIEFTIGGAQERGPVALGKRNLDALHNENAALFSKRHNGDFQAIKDAIEARARAG